MSRSLAALVLGVVLVAAARAGMDDDPIGKKLDAAKAEYAKTVEASRAALLDLLKVKADDVKKLGDLKTLEKVEAETAAFKEKGELPKSVPTKLYSEDVRRARLKLVNDYTEAVREYTKAGNRTLAKAAQENLEAFKKADPTNQAKETAVDDGFGVGVKLTGWNYQTWVENGKAVKDKVQFEVEVTARSGEKFTAEAWGANRSRGREVEGTIKNGVVKWAVTKALTDNIRHAVDNEVFTGNLQKGVLTGTVTSPKTEKTFRGMLSLQVSKK